MSGGARAGIPTPARVSTLRPAWRIARRELRGGLKGFGIFLACLALGVAAIAAVGSVRSAISEGLSREGRAILGGDAEVEFTYRHASPEELAWMKARALVVSETVEFRSMVAAPAADGDLDRALTQVKGVDGPYPLYGEARLSDGADLDAALANRDGTWGVVMARALVDRLGLEVGDRVKLGRADYELRAVLEREPDEAAAGMAFGPRTLMRNEALAESGLVAPGTLYETNYRLRLAPEVSLGAMQQAMTEAFPESGLRWRDRRNGAPGVQNFVERIAAFLVLVGLAALAMGGVGVSAAVRSYMERKTDTIATLKTLGAEGRTIFAIYLVQVGALALLGVGIGLAIGAAIPALAGPLLEDRLPVPALFDVYARPLWEAGIYGLLAALIFALWPLARARDVRAAALYREAGEGARAWPRASYLLLIAGLTALLVAAAVAFSGIWQVALGFAGGVAGALLALWLAAFGVRALGRSLARGRRVRGRPALRLALGAVGGATGETSGVVLSLGLGLAVLAAVGQIDWNLRHVIDADLPAKAPAYFFVDVQNDQLDGFLGRAEAFPGVEDIETAPMLRGVITKLNGVPAAEAVVPEEFRWVLRGDRGVTYSAEPPRGTEITEGAWWPQGYDGETLVSFSDEHGKGLGLKLGDTVTVSILGREITARIASFREVNFRDMGINFLMVMSPGALAGAPHTHIATVYAEPAAEGPLLRELAGAFPNITAIRVRDAIDRVSEALSQLAEATRWGASVTLVTGLVVLTGAAAAGERRRVYEAAVLKTLGAARGVILASFALRSAMLGAAAGIVALAAGVAASWAVMVFVMDAPYRFEPVSALVIVVGGALASLVAGLLFAVRPLAARPAQVLRARE